MLKCLFLEFLFLTPIFYLGNMFSVLIRLLTVWPWSIRDTSEKISRFQYKYLILFISWKSWTFLTVNPVKIFVLTRIEMESWRVLKWRKQKINQKIYFFLFLSVLPGGAEECSDWENQIKTESLQLRERRTLLNISNAKYPDWSVVSYSRREILISAPSTLHPDLYPAMAFQLDSIRFSLQSNNRLLKTWPSPSMTGPLSPVLEDDTIALPCVHSRFDYSL